MSERCQRCDEKIKPVSPAKDWPSRLRGQVTLHTHRVSWVSYHFGSVPSLERPRITHSEMDLCDGCWGELLSWATQPEQERRKIAAENRRNASRVEEVAEARRAREIQQILKETPNA